MYLASTKQVIRINEQLRAVMERAIEDMAEKALRTICIAYKEVGVKTNSQFLNKDSKGVYEAETNDFILVGILGIKDILREEVPKAV